MQLGLVFFSCQKDAKATKYSFSQNSILHTKHNNVPLTNSYAYKKYKSHDTISAVVF